MKKRLLKKGASPEQQKKIDYAYLISNYNNDFIYTLEAENGNWDTNRSSIIVGANGYRDVGLCQLNRQWHSSFIDSPAFKDYKNQLHYCWDVFTKAMDSGRIRTTFYGYNRKHIAAKNFTLNQ